jgi:TRAP-type C4-dicarboxylate transport system substrate-binding protein
MRMLSLVTAVVGIFVAAQPALSVETVKLTAVSGYAPTALWVSEFQNSLIPEVNRRLEAKGNYKIEWVEGWGTIAKPRGELDAIQYGLADIGVVQTVFHPDKLPMYAIAFVTPFTTADIDLMSKTVNSLVAKYPQMRNVWDKYNQVLLTVLSGVDNFQIVLKTPIEKPADLRGRKICGAGPNLRFIEGVGAIGVASTLVEWYNNIKGGICDGAIVWPEAAANFKLYEVAPYFLNVNFGGATSMALTFNQDRWKKLPAEVRSALSEAAETYRKSLARKAMDGSAAGIKTYVASGGKLVPVSADERVRWAKSLPNLAQQWAAELEKSKIPGKEIVRIYMQTMKDEKQPIARDWSE